MKKWIFLSLVMVFAVFAITFIAVPAAQSRDGPLITAPVAETNATQISVPIAIIAIFDNGSNVNPAEVRAEAVTAAIANERQSQSFNDSTVTSDQTGNLPVRSMKLPLADSGRKYSHLTVANHGYVSYHHRA